MDEISGRLRRDVLAALDSAADGGDVALADLPRTRYQPAVPRVERDQRESPWFPVIGVGAWFILPMAIWTAFIAGLAWWAGWRPSTLGGWW